MITRLTVRGFRNLRRTDWPLAPGRHLLLGGNGAGKTSLLEAAYVVATTRSFRTAQLQECVSRASRDPGPEPAGTASFAIAAEVDGSRRSRLELSFSVGSLVRQLDGASVPLPKYLEPLPVVAWSASEAEVLKGEPEKSRRLLDRGLVSENLSRLTAVSEFRHCLRQKRELLRRRQAGLEEWNALFARAAAEIIRLRASYTSALAEELQLAQNATRLPYPPITLSYEPSPAQGRDGVESIERRLAAVVDEERHLRRPLIGPQRDRLRVMWGDSEVARVASAGERKAVGLLLLRAQVAVVERGGRSPLVLVDDVDAELDLDTLGELWGVLAMSGQLVASSNRPTIWSDLEVAATWSVDGGRLDPISKV